MKTKHRPLPMTGGVKKGFHAYVATVLAVALMLAIGLTAYAADDPVTVVNNLSEFSAPVSGR